MTKEKSPARQGPRYIFYFLMLAILGWFIFMQFFGADERTVSGNSPSLLYPGTFTWEKSDGTTEEITVPGSYDVPAGETMVITSTLPSDFDASSIAIRSSLQDVNIYINGWRNFSQSDGFYWCCTVLLRCRLCICLRPAGRNESL